VPRHKFPEIVIECQEYAILFDRRLQNYRIRFASHPFGGMTTSLPF